MLYYQVKYAFYIKRVKMFEKFQYCPTWIVIAFIVIWVIGWLFYLLRIWGGAKSIERSKISKQKMVVKPIGGIIGFSIILWKMDWIKHKLLSGLSGVHAVAIAVLAMFIILFLCSQITSLLWRLLARSFRRNNN